MDTTVIKLPFTVIETERNGRSFGREARMTG